MTKNREAIFSVYMITNTINDKKYIGITSYKNPYQRWSTHKCASKTSNTVLYKAMRKYGVENFEYKIICQTWSLENCKDLEISLIKEHRTHTNTGYGYNMTEGGDAGFKHTPETIEHLREINTGENNPRHGKEPWNKGLPMSDKTKKKLTGKRECMRGINSKKANKYIITYEDGRVETIKNLTHFAKENGYRPDRLFAVIHQQRRKRHKDIIGVKKVEA